MIKVTIQNHLFAIKIQHDQDALAMLYKLSGSSGISFISKQGISASGNLGDPQHAKVFSEFVSAYASKITNAEQLLEQARSLPNSPLAQTRTVSPVGYGTYK